MDSEKENFENTFLGKPNTIRLQTHTWKRWIEPYVKEIKLPELYKIWRNAGLAPSTIKMNLSIFKRYKIWNDNLTKKEEIEYKKYIKYNSSLCIRKERKILSKEEILVAGKKWDQIYPNQAGFIFFGGHAGLRLGETLALQWKDIDFIKKTISVNKTYHLRYKSIGSTKNGLDRTVGLSEMIERSLLIRYNLNKNPEERLFTFADVKHRIKRIGLMIGIPHLHYHLLRHSFATLALESKQSIRTVANALGHKDISTTLNIYWNTVETKLDLNLLK